MPNDMQGFLRLAHIIGDRRRGIPPIIPVSKSTWWAGIASGRYPKPIRHGRVTMWRVGDISELCRRIAAGDDPPAGRSISFAHPAAQSRRP